jgi:hypothetical protein
VNVIDIRLGPRGNERKTKNGNCQEHELEQGIAKAEIGSHDFDPIPRENRSATSI